MTHGVNETSVYEVTVSDTGDHYLPDTDGLDGAAEPPYDIRTGDEHVVKIVNNQDQDASVTLEGTTFDDDGFAEGTTDVGSVTVAANGGVEALETSTPWSYLRVHVTFATAPTGNNPVKAVFASDKQG